MSSPSEFEAGLTAARLFPDVASVLGTARRLLPREVRLVPREELRRRYRALAGVDGVRAWEPSGAVRELSGWGGGEFLPAFELRGGPARLLLVASPHADEPIGVATALAVMEGLAAPEARDLRAKLSVAVVPMANPAGYAANEAWFAGANALEEWFDTRAQESRAAQMPVTTDTGDNNYQALAREYLADYLLLRRRSLPEDDVEFGYGAPEGDPDARPERATADYLPPCRAHAAYFDDLAARWHGLDVFAPLHSMGVAGGAWALLRVAPADVAQPGVARLMESYVAAAREAGLGLHDDDRGGEKGFWRLAPGFHTTPTAEAMRAYFAERGDTIRIRYNSVQAMGARARHAVIPEVPLFEVAPLADGAPLDRPLQQVLTERAATSAECARSLEGLHTPEAEGHRRYWERNAQAFARQASDVGRDTPALRREEARARSEAALRPALAHALASEARGVDPDRVRMRRLAASLLESEGWRPVPLRSQAFLQIALALAALRA